MDPKPMPLLSEELFRPRRDKMLKMSHPLIRLSQVINWEIIEREFAGDFSSGRGRPALPPRLVAGLLYLQHANDASDEAVVATWLENPQEQAVRPARAGGEVHQQGQGPNPV